MLEKDIIKTFNFRELNSKTNNFIFSEIDNFEIIDKISNECWISTPENDIDVSFAKNIKIDLAKIRVEDILSYTLNILKELSLIDVYFDYFLDFYNKSHLLKFRNVLHNYNIVCQLIFYNLEKLTLEEQMLFNEIYHFNSIFFNSSSFIKDDNFQTYLLTNGRGLNDKEHYTKIKLLRI